MKFRAISILFLIVFSFLFLPACEDNNTHVVGEEGASLGTISGIVSSGGRAPVEGALVEVVGLAGKNDITDVNGRYTIYQVPLGPQTLRITKAGYKDANEQIYVNQGDGNAVMNINMQEQGPVDFIEKQGNGENGITGLVNPVITCVSPDGKHLYLTAYNSSSILAFSRDINTGKLTFVEQETTGLNRPFDVVVSPDGKHVYTTSVDNNSVVFYTRDSNTGALTYLGSIANGVGNGNSLMLPSNLYVSSNNGNIYVSGRTSQAVAVFTRNPTTGNLTYLEKEQNGALGVTDMVEPYGICESVDGKNLYVAGGTSNSVVVFSRNTTTGSLTFLETQVEGGGGVSGLQGTKGVVVSPDDKFLYVVAGTTDTLVVFSRNITNGSLTFVEKIEQAVTGLDNPRDICMSPDGNFIYSTGSISDSIAVLRRNAADGTLTFVEKQVHGVGGVDGLDGARGGSISPDGKYFYAVGYTSNAVVTFSR